MEVEPVPKLIAEGRKCLLTCSVSKNGSEGIFCQIVLVVWPVTESSAPKSLLYLAVSCCFLTPEILNWGFFGQKFQILV